MTACHKKPYLCRDKQTEILKKISDKSIAAGVVGLGYVGLPLAVEIARAGFKTTGFDLLDDKVSKVNNGENYISDVNSETLKALTADGMLKATTDFSRIAEMDFIAICVPTPLDTHQQPDLSYIEHSSIQIAEYLKKDTMVVLESTTFPGTTSDIVRPILEKGSGLVCGKDFYLAFSPERVDPGNVHYKTHNTPKVVGAIGQDAEDVIKTMYESFLEGGVYPVSYGFQAFYPGPGLGGHCIPLDPYYLSWKVREYAFHTSMIETSMMINDRMPEYCVQRIANILNEFSKSLKGSDILVLGVAYKADIDDCRESPAIRVINVLRKKGANVRFYDPYVKEYHDKGVTYTGETELSRSLLSDSDITVITTAHTCIDYNIVQQYARFVFDTRNAMKDVKERNNIELL